MRTIVKLIATCLLISLQSAGGAYAADMTVGVNVVGVQNLSETQQDAVVDQLQKAGVKTVRTLLSDKSAHFLTTAYQHGIGAVVIIDPLSGNAAASQHARRAKPPLTTWSVGRLSDADPEGFKTWLAPLLATLHHDGVKLTALEIGNELNSPSYNGDFDVPGDGRVLGSSDLQKAWKTWSNHEPVTDPEATNLARGFTAYLAILSAARDVERDTPIITAGAVYNTERPHPAAHSPADRVAHGLPADDFIHFLRQHGLDDRVDGYGIHIYYSTPANINAALSICGGPGNKPCWLTEWGGYPTRDASCTPQSPGDASRAKFIAIVRAALRPFISHGLLVSAMYYSWNSGGAIYLPACNDVTSSGRQAISAF